MNFSERVPPSHLPLGCVLRFLVVDCAASLSWAQVREQQKDYGAQVVLAIGANQSETAEEINETFPGHELIFGDACTDALPSDSFEGSGMLVAVNRDHWEVIEVRDIPLSPSEPAQDRHCLSLVMQRVTARSRFLRVILTKLHHLQGVHLDATARDIVWTNMLGEARHGQEEWLVTGLLRSKSSTMLYQVIAGHTFLVFQSSACVLKCACAFGCCGARAQVRAYSAGTMRSEDGVRGGVSRCYGRHSG